MSSVTLTLTELNRIRGSVAAKGATSAESRREYLKKLSEERVQRWPNTLDALRQKKENWKRDKLEKEELVREEIDRQEALLQKQARINSILRANEILYEETDKMKSLRSQQLHMDVLDERKRQIEEKEQKVIQDKEETMKHHYKLKTQWKAAEERDHQESEVRKEKARKTAKAQREQLEEYKARYIDNLQREQEEGIMIRKKAQQDLLAEREANVARMKRDRQAAKEMMKANSRLREIKAKVAAEENAEIEKTQKELENQQAVAKARKELETRRFNDRQRIRQNMIDKACAELANFVDTSERILARQIQEARDKEDAAYHRKEEARQRLQAQIDESRALQLRLKVERDDREMEANLRLADAWRRRNREMLVETEMERRQARDMNILTRKDQLRQMADQHDGERREREQKFAQEVEAELMDKDEDERFRRYVKREMDKATDHGQTTMLLERTLRDPSSLSLMAHGTSAIGRK